MAGCDGSSMSWNAIETYKDGAIPRSKWTKEAFVFWLNVVLRDKQGIETEEVRLQIISELLQEYPMWFLKKTFLDYHSWHHASKAFNETRFFCINKIKVDMFLSGHCDLTKDFEQAKIDRFMEQRAKTNETMRKKRAT